MKRALIALLLAIIASLIHLPLFVSSWGERFEMVALDLWFNLRGPVAPPDDVVVVAMDESSYRVLDLPMDRAWPRSLHADLMKKLSEYNVRRVVFDILFLNESADRDADTALADSFSKAPVILGTESAVREQLVGAGRYIVEELHEPPPLFSKNISGLGLVLMPEDFGYVRRLRVPRSPSTENVPSLAEAAAGRSARDISLPGPRDLIWYYGPPGTVVTYPYHQILNPTGALPRAALEDKVVFVGLSLRTELGPAQKDTYRTPFFSHASMFGVEIQATVALNLLSDQWIKRWSPYVEGALVFVISLILGFALFALRPQWGVLVALTFAIVWLGGAFLLFLNGRFLPSVTLVAVYLPAVFISSTLGFYLVTYRKQQQVERAFQYYLSPEMARRMRDNPRGLSLGGENVFATALFTDIAGFTDITEKMHAAEVSEMLNAYFTEVMNVVFENDGTLIKFIGDAVFVLWGAPIKISDHARRACDSALAIQREVARFNATKRFPPLITRIGIHTGAMVVGNLGSERRFDYTAIGDSVNLASRLEGLNKYLGTSILISEATRKELAGHLDPIALGSFRVVGKKESVALFTILEGGVNSDTRDLLAKALLAFRSRRWDDAQGLFHTLLVTPFERLAQLYLEQISLHRASPPSEEWGGEIVFGAK